MSSRSAWADQCGHLMRPPGECTYRRTKPVAGEDDLCAEMDLQEGLGKLLDGFWVGEVQLVARTEAARLSASTAATCTGPASVIPHGFEVGILQR